MKDIKLNIFLKHILKKYAIKILNVNNKYKKSK